MKPQHCSRRDAAPSSPSSYSMAPPHFPPNGFKFPLHGLRHPALYPRGLFPPGMFHPDSRFSIPPLLALSTVHHSRLPGRLGGYLHPFQHVPRGYHHPQDEKSPNRSIDHGLSYSGGGGSRMHGSGSPVSSHAEKRKYKNHLMSRSPTCSHSRSRSPVNRQAKTRSPSSVPVRSRSPVCHQGRSGSPPSVQQGSGSPGSPFSSMQSARAIKCTQSTSQTTSCNTTVTNSDTSELRRHINSSTEEVRGHLSNSTDEIWEQQNVNREDYRREEIGRHVKSKAEDSWNQRREKLERQRNSITEAWNYRRDELERHRNSSTEEAWDQRREELERCRNTSTEEAWDHRREELERCRNSTTDEVWDQRREELVRHRNSSTEEVWDNRTEELDRCRNNSTEEVWDHKREELVRCRNSSTEEAQDHRREELERCRNSTAEEAHDPRRDEFERHRNSSTEEAWSHKREELDKCRNSSTEETWDHTREELVSYKGHHTDVRLHTASHTEEVRRHTDSQLEDIRYADSHTEEIRRNADGQTEELGQYLDSYAEEMKMHTDCQAEKDVNCSGMKINDVNEHHNTCNRMSSSERKSSSDDEPSIIKSSHLATSESSTIITTASSSAANGESSSSLSSKQVFPSDSADHLEPQTEPLSLVKNAKSSNFDDLVPSASNQGTVLAPNRPFRNIIKISRLGGSTGTGSGFSQILPLKKRICTAFAMEQDTAILPFRAPLALNSIRGCMMTDSVAAHDDHTSIVDFSEDLTTYMIDSSHHHLSKKHGLKGSSMQMTSKKRKSRNQRDRSVSGLKKHASVTRKSKSQKAQHKPLLPVTNSQRRTRSQTRRNTEVEDQVQEFADLNTDHARDKTTGDTMSESPSNISSSKGKVSSLSSTKVMETDAKQDSRDNDNDNCSTSKTVSSLAKASMKKDLDTKCVDRGVKHMKKGSKRPSSRCNSVMRNKNITSVKKNVCKSNFCKKAKCTKLQGKGTSHRRNSATAKEDKTLKRKQQTKMGSCDNDNENQGLHTDNSSMHVVQDTNIHVSHISCTNPAKSLVHNVSSTLQTSDKCDSESPPSEKHLDLVSNSLSSDGTVKGMKVVGTLSPIIKTLLGQPARGVRDVTDPVPMQQLSLKIPDAFMSKATGGAYRSGFSAVSYPEVKVDVDAEEESRTDSKDSKLLSPKLDYLKSCESERDSITIKDLSVKICRLSPKALSEKKTARASVVEKQACPITSHMSLSKSSDFVKQEDQPHGSGLLEDLLWQVQKGYFLRRGEEKSSVSIDEAASVTQAVSYDENSIGCECTSIDSSHATAVCQNESQSRKAEVEGQSYEVPVEEISDDEILNCKQQGQATCELQTNKQKYDSEEDNSDLSDRPLVIDIPPEDESNEKSSLLDSSKHASPNATEVSSSEPNSVNKAPKYSQRKPRKVHRKSSKRCKSKTDTLEEENDPQVPQDLTSSNLSGELEKDIIDNGKDSGIESAGIPEQLKESPCEVSEAGERQNDNSHESNDESQKLPNINSAIIKSASSMPKTTMKNRLRFRGIDDICASLVIKKVANKEVSINQSSLTSAEEVGSKSRVEISESTSSEEPLPCNQYKQEVVNEKMSEIEEAKTVACLSQEKTELEEKPVPSPQEDLIDTSMENKVEVSEKPVQSVKKDIELQAESELESSRAEMVSAEIKSDAETLAKNETASMKVHNEYSAICERSVEQVVGNTGPLESEKALVKTTAVDSVASLSKGTVEDSQMDTSDTKKSFVATDVPQANSFRHGSRAAKRKALAHIRKDKKDASDMQDEAAVVKGSNSLSPQPTKKKRGRPSKLQAKCSEQGNTRLKHSDKLIEQSALPEDVPVQQEQCHNSEKVKPPIRHKKLGRKKAKSVPCDSGDKESSISKSLPSPVNENMKVNVALEKSDDVKEENQAGVKQCSDRSDHSSEGATKRFFTSHSARSKFSQPYMLLSSLINSSSRRTLSPPYSVKKAQPTTKSSLDIYDFDEDDEEVELKAVVKCSKSPTTDKSVVSGKGKRGRKPKCQEKLTQPRAEAVVEQIRDYVQRTESYQPQSRFLRPRNRINYNENELDKPRSSEAKDSNAKQCLQKTSVSIKKPTLSLKIKVPRPVAKVDSAVSGENQVHQESDVTVFNRDPPQSESNMCSKVHQRQHRESSSNSHKMTVTSETISITTNEVTHYGSDSDDLHEYSQPIIRAPDISEMNAHHHNKDSKHPKAVLNHHVRFRLIKIGQGLWKTSSAVHNPSNSKAVDKQYEHASTHQEQSVCMRSDDDGEDDDSDNDLNSDTEDDKLSLSSSNSGMPDLNEDAGYFAQIDVVDDCQDDAHDNSSSSPPVLQPTSSDISQKRDQNISYASSDFDASSTSVSVNLAANSFSSSVSPKSQHSDTRVSVFASPNSAPLKSKQKRKSAYYDSSSVIHPVLSINEKHSLQLSSEPSPAQGSSENNKLSRSSKFNPEIHFDHASTSSVGGNNRHKQHQSSRQSSCVRSGHRRKSTDEDHKVNPCPKQILCSRFTSVPESNDHHEVSVEDSDRSKLELLPPDLELFVDNSGKKTGPRKVSEPKPVLKTSPRLKYLACVEDISDPDSDDEKEKVEDSQIHDCDMPVLYRQGSQSQVNSSNGQAKDIDNNGAGFLVPTPPPKYEPENVLEEAVQFDSEMSQSSCSTPSYPIVSPLTLGENKPEKVDNDSKSVEADEIDFAESFLNGARTLSAEIEETIRKQQQQQIQMEKQGETAKCGQELLPAVDITPFAPDFQDMDYVYDLGLMSMSSTTNGTVYGSLNPAVINNKIVQNQDCSSQSTGSNRSDKKSSENKRRTAKSRSKKHSASEKQVTSSPPARIDNEMDKLLSQQSVGFELLDDFDETPFSVNGRTVPNQLGDLFEPSVLDNMNGSHGTDFTFSQSDSRDLHATPSYDSASDVVLQCVDIKEQSKTFIHRQGNGSGTQCQPSHGIDTQRLTNQGSRHDVSMGTSTMGMHTCDCGAQFTDQWSYQEHEVFCSGPHLFNCGL